MSVIRKVQVRRGTSAAWSSANPVLSSGEFGYDETNDKVKIGDGSTAWNSLAFAHYKPAEVDALISQDIVKNTTIEQASANSGGTWGPRDGAIIAFLNGSAFLIGGWAGDDYDTDWNTNGGNVTTNQVYRTDDLGETWTRVKDHDPTPDATHFPMVHTPAWTMHTVSGTEYVYLCAGDTFTPFSDVYRSSNGTTWAKVNSVTPPYDGVFLMAAGSIDGKLYLAGGHTDLTAATARNTVYKSTDNGATWTQLSNAPWAERFCKDRLPSYKGKLWVVSGGKYDNTPASRVYYNDVWSFDPTTETWTEVLADGLAPWAGRQYANVFVFDGWLYISRGVNASGNLSDTWRTLDGVNWIRVEWDILPASHADALGTDGENVLIAAGNHYLGGSPTNADSPTFLVSKADVGAEKSIVDIATAIASSQVTESIYDGIIYEGYTEGTDPREISPGSNNKLLQVNAPNYDEGQPQKAVFGCYVTASGTFLYLGGGLSNSVECVQDFRVYLGAEGSAPGTQHLRMTTSGTGFKANSLGIGTDAPTQGIEGYFLTAKVGATDTNSTVRTNNTNKQFRLEVPNYANGASFQALGAYTISSQNIVYVGGGLTSAEAATRIDFFTAASVGVSIGTHRMRIDGSGVWINDGGTMKLIQFGAADSGGTGFKALRVVN